VAYTGNLSIEHGAAMKRLLIACFLSPASALAAGVQEPNIVYKCEQASGTVEYGNGSSVPTGCKRIDVSTTPVVTIPAPKGLAAKPNAPRTGEATRPADFPKVDFTAQRARDDDRKRVLEGELKIQEDRLADLRREFNNGEPDRRGDERNYQKYLERAAQLKDDIARAEGNIVSLKREIGNVRDTTN
jgi:hypothetical protein